MSNIIKIGTSEPSVIKIGTTNVAGVYVGTVKVYPTTIKDYLRTVARGTGAISLTIGSAVTTSSLSSISYSTNGSSWTTANNVDGETVTLSVSVASGDTVYWKGTGLQTAISSPVMTNNARSSGTVFSSSTEYDVEGNIMSILNGDNFENSSLDSSVEYHFSGLFGKNTNLINASGLTLPSIIVYQNTYNDLFRDCSNMVSSPLELPATTLSGDTCYVRMFQGCSAMTTTVSVLPASTLTTRCYQSMFNGCRSLTTAPVLSATTLASRCCDSMFYRCSSLTAAPSLQATTLADYCCSSMFNGCTSLATAPVLPATTLADHCYYQMFYGCTSLSAITCLATDISASYSTGSWVYNVPSGGIFTRNTNMTGWTYGNSAVPSGWTVTPPYYAWNKAPVTDYICDSETYTKYYKEYYQESYDLGTTWQNVTPVQWRQSSDVIEYNSTDCGYVPPVANYFKITSLAANNTITLRNNSRLSSASTFSYSTDNGTTWSSFSLTSGQTQTITTLASGDTLMMYGTNTTLGKLYNYGHYFRGTGDYEISGEISSLVNGSDLTDTEIGSAATRNFTFAQLFSGDTHLVSAENLKISSTALPQSCFNSTFRSCTSLVKAPTTLPATVLGGECYSSMFEGCIALAYPPEELYFVSADNTAYNRMFCMSRNSMITTPAMTSTPKLFGDWGTKTGIGSTTNQQMFCGNGNLVDVYCYWTNTSGSFSHIGLWVNYTADSGVTFHKRSTQTFPSGTSGIKTGWTVVNDDTTQPT